jgi:hypothetical protein
MLITIRVITTYKELSEFLHKFDEKGKNRLKDNILLLGEGGLSKSYITKDFDCSHFNGHITPLRAFQLIEDNPKKNIIWDDMDDLLVKTDMVKLLKQCCELADTKKVMFKSTGMRGAKSEEVDFTGYNLIILNKLKSLKEKNLSALATRFLVIEFKPSKEEVFNYLCGYAQDEEVLVDIKYMLPRMKRLHLRLYEHLIRLKKAKMNWRNQLVDYCETKMAMNNMDKRESVKYLLKQNLTDEMRIAQFKGSRASWFRFKKIVSKQSEEMSNFEKMRLKGVTLEVVDGVLIPKSQNNAQKPKYVTGGENNGRKDNKYSSK